MMQTKRSLKSPVPTPKHKEKLMTPSSATALKKKKLQLITAISELNSLEHIQVIENALASLR